ncbi:MAG: hypothetical protein AAFQ51_02540 [Pseudomonadota bacterium]
MIPYLLVAALIGAALGVRNAKRRGGNTADMVQYALGFGIAFTLATLFALLILDNLF